jgi:hypothetical protein
MSSLEIGYLFGEKSLLVAAAKENSKELREIVLRQQRRSRKR